MTPIEAADTSQANDAKDELHVGVTGTLLPPRAVLIALGQARELPRNLQLLLWDSGDETAQSLVAALSNIETDLEEIVLSKGNTQLLSAWVATSGRRPEDIDKVAKKWGKTPHIASGLLCQKHLSEAAIEYISKCPSPSVAGGLLQHPCTPEQYKPELAVRYLKAHERLRNNVGENVLHALTSAPDVWSAAISAVAGVHPALLSSVPNEALESATVRQKLLDAVEDQQHRAATDPLIEQHLRTAIESLLRHAGTTENQLATLERLAQDVSPELASRVAARKNINVEGLRKHARCTSQPCDGEPRHTNALIALIESLNHVNLDSRTLLPSSIAHKGNLSKEHMRIVARHIEGRPDQVLKELQESGYSPPELAAGVEILGVESLALLEQPEEVVTILAGQGWEPLRYAYRLSETAREATWRHYRPARALLGDGNHHTTSMAAMLGTLDPPSLETALMLLHTWTGSISELVAAAQVLSRSREL